MAASGRRLVPVAEPARGRVREQDVDGAGCTPLQPPDPYAVPMPNGPNYPPSSPRLGAERPGDLVVRPLAGQRPHGGQESLPQERMGEAQRVLVVGEIRRGIDAVRGRDARQATVLEEADETVYWLICVRDAGLVRPSRLDALLDAVSYTTLTLPTIYLV